MKAVVVQFQVTHSFKIFGKFEYILLRRISIKIDKRIIIVYFKTFLQLENVLGQLYSRS